MNWAALTTVFLLSIVKFMFAPFSGRGLGLPFWETFLACLAGGIFGAAIFYFSSELLIKYTHKRRVIKKQQMIAQGLDYKEKKKFTRTNRFIIRVKRSLGIYGISLWAPFFLSVPVGSIITAKFYGKQKATFPLIILGLVINGFVMSALVYLIF
jgi:hypothetical protein